MWFETMREHYLLGMAIHLKAKEQTSCLTRMTLITNR
jgi:hypothetical protein